MPMWDLENTTYHEGLPGHHMQISIAQELTGIPKFRTQADFTAYAEGWGLYTELLAKEMGFYTDPYSEWQLEQTAIMVRYCWAKYPNLKHVISHARIDPQRRGDPGSNFPWPRFKERVLTSGSDPVPVALAQFVKPVTEYPPLDPKVVGGCCP